MANTLNLRDLPGGLLLALKVAAAKQGMTLKQYSTEVLSAAVKFKAPSLGEHLVSKSKK